MPGHSRSKNGVASLAYVPGIHVFRAFEQERRGWPGQARPWRKNNSGSGAARYSRVVEKNSPWDIGPCRGSLGRDQVRRARPHTERIPIGIGMHSGFF